MDLQASFITHIKQAQLFSPADQLLLAVSGGVDSVVLCELCKRSGFDFSILHCHFQLRGAESDRDESFTRDLATHYKVPFLSKRFDTTAFAAEHKLSIQEAARELRYHWFEEQVQLHRAAQETPTRSVWLLTAHHADDNNETVLLHLFRGTGLTGLTGIPPAISFVRRPLLPFPKSALLAFAHVAGLAFVEDSSNSSLKYTRNAIRNELMPVLQRLYPQIADTLQAFILRFREIDALYQLQVAQLKKKLLQPKGAELHIPILLLKKYNNRALVFELIRDFGFSEKQVDEVFRLMESESGRYLVSPAAGYRIIRHRRWLIISAAATSNAITIPIDVPDQTIGVPGGSLTIHTSNELQPSNSPLVATIDVRQVVYPLLLRKAKTGDYFYPLGMRRKKKIARFLIDLQLSRTQKEQVWVIESNGRIIWVVGHRIDDRCKITPGTKEVVRLSWQPDAML